MIRIIEGTPGATDTVSWGDCRPGDLVVDYRAVRWLSRWETTTRKRPFCVEAIHRGSRIGFALSWHGTLAAAISAAKRWDKEISR